MSEVANKELCQELYELSGWLETHYIWRLYNEPDMKPEWVQTYTNIKPEDWLNQVHGFDYVPAYSLGYLLRKLPRSVPNDHNGGSYWFHLCFGDSHMWHASYDNAYGDFVHDSHADTPEDAACKLAIELFKQGVLQRV